MSVIQEILVSSAGGAETERSIRAIKFGVDLRVSVDIKTTVNRVRDFASLAKPEITFMVMISAGLAFVVASSSLRVVGLLHTMVGTGLVAQVQAPSISIWNVPWMLKCGGLPDGRFRRDTSQNARLSFSAWCFR